MLNIFEITSIILAEITRLTQIFPFLKGMGDQEMMDLMVRQGIDINNPEFIAASEALMGGNEAGAQCLRGKGIEKMFSGSYDMLPENIKKFVSHAQFKGIFDGLLGHVVVYYDALARNILRDIRNVTQEAVVEVVRLTMAHEIRHSFQDNIEISYVGLADLIKYATQPHEADAYAFQFAVGRGEASIEEAATWVPTQEQLDEVRVIFERIAAQRAAA